MSTYTTGELAKRAGISVRTLQYYDQKEILVPTTSSAGGRRIYTDEDFERLKLVLLLKSLGLKLAAIQEILTSDNAQPTLDLLLREQTQRLTHDRDQATRQLRAIAEVQRELTGLTTVSLKSIQDMNRLMKNNQSLKRIRLRLVAGGLAMDVLEIAGLIYSWQTGNWWVFGGTMAVAVVVAVALMCNYMGQVAYVCPNCQTIFKPGFWEAFWAGHSPRTRKLTCPHCGQKAYCVEVFANPDQVE